MPDRGSKRDEQYGGSRYRKHQENHQKMRVTDIYTHQRNSMRGGGHHHGTWSGTISKEDMANFVEYHGDRIGLINIARLIPHFNRRRRKRR